MHCLYIVRKSYFREYYKDFGLFRQPEARIWGHIDACGSLISGEFSVHVMIC